MRGKKPRPPKTLGELIAQRRRELSLTQVELARRIKGRHSGPVTQARIEAIESERMGPVRLPILEQLPRVLRLERDVVYFWGGQIPPDIRPSGLSENTVRRAWAAMRKVIASGRRQGQPVRSVRRSQPSPKRKREREPGLRGWQGRKTVGGLIGWRRRKLGLTIEALGQRIMGPHGESLSKQRLNDIEHDRGGVPRRPLLRQLARALRLNLDVLYLWAGRLPPDIRPRGLSDKTVQKALSAFRDVIARTRTHRAGKKS